MGRFITDSEILQYKKMVEQGDLKQEEFEDLVIEGTPTLWMEEYLRNPDNPDEPFVLRPMQHELLQPGNTVCVRWGRQLGKEQPYSALILTPSGWRTMKNIHVGDQVIGSNGLPAKVEAVYEQGIKDVYCVEFDDGSKAECGLDHLWTYKDSSALNRSWFVDSLSTLIDRYGMDMDKGSFVIPVCKPTYHPEQKHEMHPYIVGLILSAGKVERNLIRFENLTEEQKKYIETLLPSDYIAIHYEDNQDFAITPNDSHMRLYEWISNSGIESNGIPYEYIVDSMHNRIQLLKGLMDGYGYVNSGRLYYIVRNSILGKTVVDLVRSLGGIADVLHKELIHINLANINPFQYSKYVTDYRSKLIRPKTAKKISRVRQEKSKCIYVLNEDHTYITNDYVVTHNTVGLTGRLAWECETEPNTRCLVFAPRKKHINDIFTYLENMIKTSPRLSGAIEMTRDVKASGVASLKKPDDSLPRIKFKNGSIIIFFHTQSKTARELIRGTKGGKIFLEEAAYIEAEAFGAMSGLLTSTKDVMIYAQSTPKGKSGWYYDFSLDAEIHSHHRSSESPDWTDIKEKTARMLAGDEGSYLREYHAEFLDDGWGAFSDVAIDLMESNSLSSNGEITLREKVYLSTNQIKSIPGNVYVGIDWNTARNGTKILVWKEPSHEPGRLYYQECISIETPTYTQMTAIDRMFEIIDSLKPKRIAVDHGYASTALEIISAKMDLPEYQWVKECFEIVEFGKVVHIPIADFFAGNDFETESLEANSDDSGEEYMKIPMKNFMVNTAHRMMMSGHLVVGPVDYQTEKTTLVNELRKVRVEKISSNGHAVYIKKDLHKFSAAILAIYGFFVDKGNYKLTTEGTKTILRRLDWQGQKEVITLLGFSQTLHLRSKVGKVVKKSSIVTSRGAVHGIETKNLNRERDALIEASEEYGITNIPIRRVNSNPMNLSRGTVDLGNTGYLTAFSRKRPESRRTAFLRGNNGRNSGGRRRM